MAEYPYGPPARRNSVLVPLLIGLVAMVLVAAAAVVVVLLAWPEDKDGSDRTGSPGASAGAPGSVTDDDRDDAREAAREAVVALVSYDHRTFDTKAAEVAELSTPTFAADTKKLLDQIASTITTTKTVSQASVTGDGLVGIDEDSATVLLYLNQATTRDSGDAVTTQSAVTMALAKVEGDWLADGLETSTAAPEGPGEPDSARREVLQAATGFGTAFVSYDHRTLDVDTDDVLSRSTGAFAQEYGANRDDLMRLSTDAQSVSVGRAWSAGIVELNEGSATVLVPTTGTITSTTEPGGRTQSYRMQLTLDRVGDEWLVSDAEFVS